MVTVLWTWQDHDLPTGRVMAVADEYVVERRMRIAAPAADVYERVVDLQRWQSWSPWEDLDDALERTYEGSAGKVGQRYAWSGNRQAGKGWMEITETADNQRVAANLTFEKPFRSQSRMVFTLSPSKDGDATDVTWRLVGPKTVMVRVMGLFKSMDALVGPDFEKGLDRLREECEQAAA